MTNDLKIKSDEHLMFEANIKLPMFQNDGTTSNESIKNEFVNWICTEFGGCSISEIHGCWINQNGYLYSEKVYSIDIAMENTKRNNNKLRDIANSLKVEAKQEAIYIRLSNGQVEFI